MREQVQQLNRQADLHQDPSRESEQRAFPEIFSSALHAAFALWVRLSSEIGMAAAAEHVNHPSLMHL